MKDEIKEILDDLRNKDCYVNNETILTFDEAKVLLDYITNLEQENERLKEELQQEKKDFKEANDYCFELKDYKSRNEKAIEYMNNYIELEDAPINERIKIEFKEVKKILTGGDEE